MMDDLMSYLIHQDLDLPPLPAHFLDQLRRVSAFSFLQTTLQVAPLPVGSVLERLLTPSGFGGMCDRSKGGG